MAHVDEDGAVQIPKDIRDELGLEPGTKVAIRVEGQKIIIEPMAKV